MKLGGLVHKMGIDKTEVPMTVDFQIFAKKSRESEISPLEMFQSRKFLNICKEF